MTETKFTPGPWKYQRGRVSWGEWRILITARRGREVIIGFDERDREADGRLIAAAPELYEALRMAAKDLHSAACMISPEINPALFETVKRAEAVLAKARGEG